MIKDILKDSGIILKENNVIDMGYENSWSYSPKMVKLHNDLLTYNKEGRYYYSIINRCVTEYRWYLNDGIEDYILISKVDSSD